MITSEFNILVLCLLAVTIIPDDSSLERISTIKCKEYETATQHVSYLMGLPGQKKRQIVTNRCKHNSISLIVGGEKAKLYEFPHQALLGYETFRGIKYQCGGSLISSNFVLTAAHCINPPHYGKVKYVKLGMNRRSQADAKVFIYGVEEIIVHPNFIQRSNNNDIALVKLNATVNFTEFLYPACLPTSQPQNAKAVVSGFGKTGRFDATSEELMKVIVDKFDHRDCQNTFRTVKIQRNSMLCYGNKTHRADSCKGDSGGPLQVGNDDEAKCTYKLIGVVSFGALDCGTPGLPGIYVNVFNYLKWIEDIVWPDEEDY
ncbi:venom protease-like [Chironomus tepperi]|uniref:venom protease-like n=1 Tax=Chironomus tepperi TaxID=113505 RepID=UPI00391EE795